MTPEITGLSLSPPICCKTMEHIIHSQVVQHIDAHKILCDQQHGFRKKRSCESQLIVTLQDISASLDDGEQIDTILLDFSKAFDKVPYQRLALKLRHCGIQCTILPWVDSFLSNRSQQVLVEGHSSESMPSFPASLNVVYFGPLLFLLYVNDLPLEASSNTCLFADDSLLYKKIHSNQDAARLQDDLDRLQQWEKDWQMSFNSTKCVVIRITKKRNPIKAIYNIHNHDLEFFQEW